MFVILFASLCLASVRSRNIGREIKPRPGVSSSLINMGKIDFNFYINTKPEDFGKKPNQESSVMKQCPCMRPTVLQDSSARKHPFDILEKMVMNSQNIFSLEEPSVSSECCVSGGLVHEDILLELPSKPMLRPTNPISSSIFPFPSELLMSFSKPKQPMKDKAVEIFLFPKRKDIVGNDKMPIKNKKNDIMAVGDKQIHDDFKKIDLLPPVPVVANDINDLKLKNIDNKKEENKKQEETNTVKI